MCKNIAERSEALSMTQERKDTLDCLCRQFRIDVLDMLNRAKSGHPGGSLSVCEILTALYFEMANIGPENLSDPARDKIVMSKGHGAPMLYRILSEKGFFPKEDLLSFRQIGSHLQGHPCPTRTPGVEIATGPLGVAYPAALGLAVADKLDGHKDTYVYAILGDGETNEGVIWECAMNASKIGDLNLITIIDRNGVQLDGKCDEIMPMGDITAKWQSFGFVVLHCNGHDIQDICDKIVRAKTIKEKPVVIIADTIKGKGVSFMEGNCYWHSSILSDEDFDRATKELKG